MGKNIALGTCVPIGTYDERLIVMLEQSLTLEYDPNKIEQAIPEMYKKVITGFIKDIQTKKGQKAAPVLAMLMHKARMVEGSITQSHNIIWYRKERILKLLEYIKSEIAALEYWEIKG